MADNFLSKSVLFEVVDSKTERIENSFTLVIPPNAMSIKEPHRVSIKKTFGNAFIDDYGADNIQLVIKGITGTAHAFPTFRTKGVSVAGETFQNLRASVASGGANENYRGREAFYVFRDEIMRYKDNFADSFDQKELRVYDLADEQAYKCVLLEFSLDRTADKPFHYPYSISLFVYAKLGSKEAFSPTAIPIAKNPTDVFNSLEDSTDSLDERFKIFENVQNIRNQIAKFQNQVRLLRAQFNTWLLKARTVIESPLLITKQVLDTAGDLLGFVYDAYTQGKLAYETWINASETIEDQIREILGLYGFSITQGSLQIKEETFSRKTGMDYTDQASPAPRTTLDTFSFDGVNAYVVKGGDTLQRIAQEQLGDSDLWPYIASVNPNVTSNTDLVPGEEIYVPVSTDPGLINKDNFILTEDELRNPYGTDIRIDQEGEIVVLESSDVSTTTGVENVLQAVDLRLKTEVNSMIKQTAYGLLTQPGLAGTAEALSYVRMGLKNALIKDPRIAAVSNIRVSIDGDTIRAGADLRLVGREQSLPIDVIVQ